MKRAMVAAFGMAMMLGGCAVETTEDGIDDAFLVDGKADSSGISEGTADACGVLRLASEADAVTLKAAKLYKRAIDNIVSYRLGPDGAAGTADDQIYDSLKELDQVPWVGNGTFGRLVTHMRANGGACKDVSLQLLSVSDWHGQIDPLSIAMVGNAGGAPALATYFQNDRRANPRTLTLTAGDAFGASPPLASFFQEKPAVEAMNLLRFDADSLGNHNFDRGLEHLRSMIELARYPFLSANLEGLDKLLTCPTKPRKRCVEPYRIFMLGGVKVAVIGLTNPDAESLNKPGAFGMIRVGNPMAAALNARALAAAEGAQVFVVLVHMGATSLSGGTDPEGPLLDLAKTLTGFDVILGDHTNIVVNKTVNGAVVVENKSQGATYARVSLTYDFAAGHAVGTAATIVTPLADMVTPDPAVTTFLAPYRTELAKAFDGKIATATGLYERGSNVERLREVPIGNLVADALRLRYGTQLGYTNGGGIRAPLPSSYLPADLGLRRPATGYAAGPPYDIVVGDVFAMLPFGNAVSTRTITGAQLWKMLEHSVEALPAANGWFGQISGFKFVFDSTKPAGSRVRSVTLDGGATILADTTRYTLATSDFIALGGDGYTMLAGGDDVTREKMADVVLDHIRTLATLDPKTEGRITDQPATP